MRTVDPEKHRQRRLQIIGAASELFATKGLARTTTAEICRAAGISTGQLFHYFPSKQAIFHGMFEIDRHDWNTALETAAANPDPWAALMGIVDQLAADARHPTSSGLMLEIIAQAHRDPECAALVADNDRQLIRGIAELIERLVDSQLADPQLPAENAARWVLTLVDGFHGRGYPEPDLDPDAELVTAKQLIARMLRCTGPA